MIRTISPLPPLPLGEGGWGGEGDFGLCQCHSTQNLYVQFGPENYRFFLITPDGKITQNEY